MAARALCVCNLDYTISYAAKHASLLQVRVIYSHKSFIWYWFQEEAEGSPNAGHDPGEVVQKRLLASKVIKLFYVGIIS